MAAIERGPIGRRDRGGWGAEDAWNEGCKREIGQSRENNDFSPLWCRSLNREEPVSPGERQSRGEDRRWLEEEGEEEGEGEGREEGRGFVHGCS